MTRILLLLAALAAPAPLRPAGSALPATPTVKAGGADIVPADFIITRKKGYVHLLWDAFPYRGPAAPDVQAVVADLLAGPVAKKFPKAVKVKVDVVEFPDRDEYGAPRWESIRRVAAFQALKKGGKWKIGKKLF